MKASLAVSICSIALMSSSLSRSEARDDLALCQEITKTQASLSEGILKAAKSEAPISAKFEFDDHGKLSLSVYTAAKGVGIDAESNVLKEWAGSPEGGWSPKAETF